MIELNIDDIVILKKPHPCKGNRFKILRVGADYKLQCLNCNKIILVDSEELQKRIKSVENK